MIYQKVSKPFLRSMAVINIWFNKQISETENNWGSYVIIYILTGRIPIKSSFVQCQLTDHMLFNIMCLKLYCYIRSTGLIYGLEYEQDRYLSSIVPFSCGKMIWNVYTHIHIYMIYIYIYIYIYINGSAQDCSNPIANALELHTIRQCTQKKPSLA